MERLDKVKQLAREAFRRKQQRRRELASAPWSEKVRAVVELQRMTYPIVKERNPRACIRDID